MKWCIKFWYFFRIEIQAQGHGEKYIFCAEDLPFLSGKPRNVEWKADCRSNTAENSATFLGTFLNAGRKIKLRAQAFKWLKVDLLEVDL